VFASTHPRALSACNLFFRNFARQSASSLFDGDEGIANIRFGARCLAARLDPGIRGLDLLVVGEFVARSVHGHVAAFQHLGACDQRQRAADIPLDREDRGAPILWISPIFSKVTSVIPWAKPSDGSAPVSHRQRSSGFFTANMLFDSTEPAGAAYSNLGAAGS
jgi:ADP-ribose pyrophosphatase YjhB (NUDIX family)